MDFAPKRPSILQFKMLSHEWRAFNPSSLQLSTFKSMDVIPKVVAEAVYKALVIDLFTNKAVSYNLKPFLNGNLWHK